MNCKIVLLSLVVLAITACKETQTNTEKNNSVKETSIDSEITSDDLLEWATAISNQVNELEKTYDPNAISIVSHDRILEHPSEIASHYTQQKNKITSIESLFEIEANKDRNIHYELVRYQTDRNQEYLQILIWKLENEKKVRVFEYTVPHTKTSQSVDTTEITSRRKLWMELCNAHDTDGLVRQVYSPNTLYFNHKPLVQGTKDLIREYQYMNNPQYRLQLDPIVVKAVNSDVAFEIGQCSGSYNGNYILVWKKQANGLWYVQMDSNI